MSNYFEISEKFYSIQAEGHTTGYPAYFIRLKGCNLCCGLDSKDLKNITPNQVITTGNLIKERKATWACDSAGSWLFGKKETFEDIVNDWKNLNIAEDIKSGRVHIIWSGGEPTLIKNQLKICNFITNGLLGSRIDKQENTYLTVDSFHEVETNGTQVLTSEFLKNINQINCSVKLQNSGMDKSRRIISKALNSIISHPNYWFKFVISVESDIDEIEKNFIKPFNIDPKKVILMPGLCNQENFHERTRFSLEMAKKYKYIGLTRLHISAWNLATGV